MPVNTTGVLTVAKPWHQLPAGDYPARLEIDPSSSGSYRLYLTTPSTLLLGLPSSSLNFRYGFHRPENEPSNQISENDFDADLGAGTSLRGRITSKYALNIKKNPQNDGTVQFSTNNAWLSKIALVISVNGEAVAGFLGDDTYIDW